MRVLVVNAYSASAENAKAFSAFEAAIRAVSADIELCGSGSSGLHPGVRLCIGAGFGQVSV